MQLDNVWIICIGLFDFMLTVKSLIDYTNLFFLNEIMAMLFPFGKLNFSITLS